MESGSEVLAGLDSIESVQRGLREQRYIAERSLSTSIYLALKLRRPLFLEGEAGVGKTEVAKAIAGMLQAELIRLQCYEGLDIYHAVYDWNYSRQMLHIRLMEAQDDRPSEAELFGPDFLLKRPLLQAIESSASIPPVLLIDELDRSDAEFEAYLLEVLSEYQITIPEIGTIKAEQPPFVVITSNRTREVHDALKRRCLYHWIDYPSLEKELAIVEAKVPAASRRLAEQVTRFTQALREERLFKVPGIAETLDWMQALEALNQQQLDAGVINETRGVLLKTQEDLAAVDEAKVDELLVEADVE